MSWIDYTKVVSKVVGNKLYVKTVFNARALDCYVVKERAYNSFKEIWKNITTNIL